MSFTNVYYKRVGVLWALEFPYAGAVQFARLKPRTPKPCYVCYKPTTTVLATINTVDFLYTCPTHLTDPGFASPFVDPAAATKPVLNPEDIGKVVAEWEDRQKRKKEKEKADKAKESKSTDKDPKDKDTKGKDKANDKDDDESTASPKLPGSLSPKPPSAPTHERFTLHRDMFTMRQGEHRKRRQTAQAKDLAPRLPGAPRGTL